MARSKRKYDNTQRAQKSAQTQSEIIQALVQLLVERRGGEVQIADIASRTGITQRTIFRFFKDRKTLHETMEQHLISYLQAGIEQLQSLDFVGFAKHSYEIFDRHEALTMAYVLSPFGKEARKPFRKKLNQAMIDRIQSELNIELTPVRLKRLALLTTLVSAKVWYDVKEDFGWTGHEMTEAIDWALRLLLKNL